MAKVTEGTAKAAAIVGFLILLCGIAVTTCGSVWLAYGGYLGHGLWSGIPVGLKSITHLIYRKKQVLTVLYFASNINPRNSLISAHF
jgi:hypothetical protein